MSKRIKTKIVRVKHKGIVRPAKVVEQKLDKIKLALYQSDSLFPSDNFYTSWFDKNEILSEETISVEVDC